MHAPILGIYHGSLGAFGDHDSVDRIAVYSGRSTNPTVDITGTSSLGARIQVVGAGQASGPGGNYTANNIGQTDVFQYDCLCRACRRHHR